MVGVCKKFVFPFFARLHLSLMLRHALLILQGVVYLRYGDAASGQAAYLKMHGRWFDGRSLIAEYLPEAAYQIRFPDAPKA